MASLDPAPLSSLSVYPAIDLKNGFCVRLFQGDMDAATVYNDDPGSQAAAFRDAGFDRLHIVDLDGAFSGKSENRRAVEAILAAGPRWRQLGGGVRDMAALAGWIEAGVDRVILGTAAVRDPQFVIEAAREFPDKVAVGVDAMNGEVKTEGWAEDGGHTALEIGKRFEDQGIAALIYTDISRDGALKGVNIDATAALAAALSIPVIASGGVADASDVVGLAAREEGIEGVIIGRALYEGTISAPEALKSAKRPPLIPG